MKALNSYFIPSVFQRLAVVAPGAIDDILKKSLLPASLLTSKYVRISYEEGRHALNLIAQVLDQPSWAISFAQSNESLAFGENPHSGLVKFACESAPTIEGFFCTLVKFRHLVNPTLHLNLVPHALGIALEFGEENSPLGIGVHHHLYTITNTIRSLRAHTGQSEVVKAMGLSGDLSRKQTRKLQERFSLDVPIVSSRAYSHVLIPHEIAQMRTRTQNSELHVALCASAQDILEKQTGVAHYSELTEVRRHIKKSFVEGDVRIEKVAHAMGMTSRSLQRLLSKHATSFKAIREAERLEQLNRSRGLPLRKRELAETIGYKSRNALRRAQKRLLESSAGP